MNKTTAVLRMYDEFKNGKNISIDECCFDYGISVPTFRRYIALLRMYFMESCATDIVYDPANKVYRVDGAP